MVGSRKLSNDEVEALLSGLDEESKDQTAQQFDPNEVREFKFGTEDLSLLGDYYALRMINEKICRFTRSVFLPMLRIMPRISSFPPEVYLNTYIGDQGKGLSGGQLQRIALSRILLNPSPIILLDEPTAKLDKNSRDIVIDAIRSLAKSSIVVIATHDHTLLDIAEQEINLTHIGNKETNS